MVASSKQPTLILDNGAGLLKLGLFRLNDSSPTTPFTAPNAIARPGSSAIQPPSDLAGRTRRPLAHLIAAEIPRAPDPTSMAFRRPHDRGVLVSFDLQRDIWTSALSTDRGVSVTPSTSRLLLTEPLAIPLQSRRGTDALIFEALSFSSAAIVPPQRLAAHVAQPVRPTCLVLDSGFSFTTAVPIVRGVEQPHAARRLALGGKALTNLLKRLISFRSWNMADETAVVAAVKERVCRVATDYPSTLATCRTGDPVVRYVLPDPGRHPDPFGHIAKEMTDEDQVLKLRNEVYAVPEALFHPADIGLEQAGVAELISQAVNACDQVDRPDLYANVILTGGNCQFPGFCERLQSELRPLVPADYDLNIRLDSDPVHTTFNGGVTVLRHDSAQLPFITKEHYFEVGTDAILRELYGD